jgi:glycosyltransferase involved in cell wall biosynthesis
MGMNDAVSPSPQRSEAERVGEGLGVRGWQIPTFELREFKSRSTRYAVCIPVINEGERILSQLAEMQQIGIPEQADILLCDGGSKDGSTEPERLRGLGLRTLLIKTGAGKLSAQLRMGYAYALQEGYEGIITIDGNGKDGVDAIPRFVEALDRGVDLVQGSRFVPGGKAINTPLSRLLAIRLIHAPLISLGARFWYTDTTNGFRGYSRRFLLDPCVQPFRDVFTTYELLAYCSVRAPQLGFKTQEIPVVRRYPDSGAIPTKIHGWQANANLMRIVLNAALGRYNPPKPAI